MLHYFFLQSISPGVVDTDFRKAAAKASGLNYDVEGKVFDGIPSLDSKDIADAVLYVLSTPPHVQVHELTIKPVGETF